MINTYEKWNKGVLVDKEEIEILTPKETELKTQITAALQKLNLIISDPNARPEDVLFAKILRGLIKIFIEKHGIG